MSEPVRLYNAAGRVFDCVAPSEVKRLLESGDWRREPWPEPGPPAQDDAGEIPFATPLPKRKPGRKAKGDWGAL